MAGMNKTRIAPTPSGYLHAGNAFNFLVTQRVSQALGSKLILRIDDLDAERTRPEYIEDVFRSLEWLGITVDEGPSSPDDFVRNWSQHRRLDRYRVLVEELRSRNVLYPCSCSRPQFDGVDRASHTCRRHSSAEAPPGTPWRLGLPAARTVRMRGFQGSEDLPPAEMPDPIILQRDTERPSYQIASLCDDLDMDITFIIRGADLLASTACQLYLAEVLGKAVFSAVRFHHHPLAMDPEGYKLSKSEGAASLKAMREAGRSAGPLISHAAAYTDGLIRQIAP